MPSTRPEDVPEFLWRSGDGFLPDSIKKILDTYILGNDTSLVYINGWSFVHLGMGVVVAKLFSDWTIGQAFLLHCAWELWQIVIKMTPATSRGLIDIFMDTLFFMTGFVLARKK